MPTSEETRLDLTLSREGGLWMGHLSVYPDRWLYIADAGNGGEPPPNIVALALDQFGVSRVWPTVVNTTWRGRFIISVEIRPATAWAG